METGYGQTDEGLAATGGGLRSWLVLLVGAVFLVWACANGVSVYGRLPDRIPTHFGPSGAPNAWAAKGILSVFGLLIAGAALLLVMALVSRLGAKWYNFPGKERVLKLAPAQQAYVIAPAQELIAWVGAAIAVAFSIGSRQIWAVALGERQGTWEWVMLLPGVVGVVGAILSIVAVRARLRAVEESQ